LGKIWNISPRTHCRLLPLLCNCLPLFDEICHRFLKFSRACLFHDTHIIRSVALHDILYARGFSFLNRNVSFCMHRYNVSVSDVLSGAFATSIQAFVRNSRGASPLATADLLVKALNLRDSMQRQYAGIAIQPAVYDKGRYHRYY
jgi:hypothetical protein